MSESDRADTRTLTSQLRAFGANPTSAVTVVEDLPPTARFARGAAGLGVCWAAALVAVFLPILHLVLVPSLLAGGVVAAFVLGRQAQRVIRVHGPCPRCGVDEDFAASGRLRAERIVTCPRCHTNVTLRIGGAAAVSEQVSVGRG